MGVYSHRVHDKKMSVLGFCALLQSSHRPQAVLNSAHLFVPAIIVQLKALVQAYQGMKVLLHTCCNDHLLCMH